MTTSADTTQPSIEHDFKIIHIEPVDERNPALWVNGMMLGHEFQALVSPDHAESAEHELDGSRILSLWVQRLADWTMVCRFDGRWDFRPTTPIAERIVDLLKRELADRVFDR